MSLLDFLKRKSPSEPVEIESSGQQRSNGNKYRRQFKAAKVNRLNFGFETTPKSVDQDLKGQLNALTTRARWLAKNDDYVRRYLKVAKNNIIGPRGIELRAQYRLNGNPDKLAIEAIETAWKEWGRDADYAGRLSFLDCQHMFVEHMARDGEVAVIMQPAGNYGLQLQFVDPMSIGVRLCKVLSKDREIIMGVEVDRSSNRPTAYYVHVNDSNQPDTFNFEGRNYRRVPAELMIHKFRQEEVHQTRGFTPLASAIQRLKMLNGYEEAGLVAARAGAAKMGFYQNSGDQPFDGTDEDDDGELLEDFEAGTMSKLPRGWDVKTFDTGWPNVDHASYVKSVLRGIASGIGVSYNTLANDLEGVNFSSIRSGVIEDREEWKGAQSWVASSFLQPVFETWVERAILLGRIRIKGQPISIKRADSLKRVTWQGRRWDWVDPFKDIKANTEAINYRIRSISDVIREQGRDPADVFEEIQREQQTLKELGIEVITNDGNRLSDPETEHEGG